MLGLGEPWRGAARARLRRSFRAGAVALLQVACSVKFLGAEAVLSAACVQLDFGLVVSGFRIGIRLDGLAALPERYGAVADEAGRPYLVFCPMTWLWTSL